MKHDNFVSLMFEGQPCKVFTLSDKSMKDIDLSYVEATFEDQLSPWLKKALCDLPKAINCVKYRQDILRDFIETPSMLNLLSKISKEFYELKNIIKFAFERDNTLYNVLKRVEESDQILNGMLLIKEKLRTSDIQSKGLKDFLALIEELMVSDLFRAYERDLNHIRSKEQIRSMKIGLNLDQDMNPVEAIVLTLDEDTFKYTRSLKRVYKFAAAGFGVLKKIPRQIFAPETLIPKENLNELEKVIEPAMGQLLKFIDTFNDSLLEVFEPLKDEIDYYQFAFDIHKSLVADGHPVCQVDFEDQGHKLKEFYNMNLAFRFKSTTETMVYNNLNWVGKGQMYLLTGANRGGKTTVTQAIGQIYWMGLLGFYVPAKEVILPMIDGLYIHFPSEESETAPYGRLGEECQRFADIYKVLTPRSLFLMNESFSGTSHLESVTIAKEALRAIAKVGCVGLFNTHLHELALNIDELNGSISDNYVFKNLVSGKKDSHQSFQIHEGEPLGKSYAHEIAIKYGVSFNQLIEES